MFGSFFFSFSESKGNLKKYCVLYVYMNILLYIGTPLLWPKILWYCTEKVMSVYNKLLDGLADKAVKMIDA